LQSSWYRPLFFALYGPDISGDFALKQNTAHCRTFPPGPACVILFIYILAVPTLS
jgi:hypothetical protein